MLPSIIFIKKNIYHKDEEESHCDDIKVDEKAKFTLNQQFSVRFWERKHHEILMRKI